MLVCKLIEHLTPGSWRQRNLNQRGKIFCPQWNSNLTNISVQHKVRLDRFIIFQKYIQDIPYKQNGWNTSPIQNVKLCRQRFSGLQAGISSVKRFLSYTKPTHANWGVLIDKEKHHNGRTLIYLSYILTITVSIQNWFIMPLIKFPKTNQYSSHK